MLNKVLQSKFIVKNTDNYLIKLGLITYQNESKFHRLFRHSLTTLGFILLGKFWLSILIWILKSNDINHCKQWIMYEGKSKSKDKNRNKLQIRLPNLTNFY